MTDPAPRSLDGESPTFVLSSASITTGLVPSALTSEQLPRVEFYEDRIVIWRADVDHALPNSVTMRLMDVGHVQFDPPGRITIGYGISRPWLELHTTVKVSRLVAEDRFDEIVTHFESHAPDHLFSSFERAQLRHSLPWNLTDILPWTNPVAHATARIVATAPIRIEFATEHHRWSVVHDNGFVLTTADDHVQEPLLQVLRSQFFQSNGMVLGAMPQFASFAYGVETGGGDALIVHEPLRGIFAGGKQIGAFRGLDGAQEIEFTEPVPEALALLLMLAQTQRQLLPGANPGLVDEPDDPEFSLATSGVFRHLRLISFALPVVVFMIVQLQNVTMISTIGLMVPWIAAAIGMHVISRNRSVECVHVYRDRVVAWRNAKNIGARLLLTPWDIGHLSFDRLATLRVWFGVPDRVEDPFIPLRLGGSLADDRDALLQHLAAMSDQQICSFEERDGRVHYSRAWTLAELLPWQHYVKTAWFHPDRGEGSRAETLSGSYPVTRRFGYSVHLPGSPHGAFLAKVGMERIYLHNGMVIGFVQGGQRVRFGSGEDVTIDARNGEVKNDGVRFGQITNDDHALKLQMVEPQPELLPILILLAFVDGCTSRPT